MTSVAWGMIGCGDVAEVKSGPAFQKVAGSTLLAVTRRDRAKADDYARRHGVPRIHADAASLIHDPDVQAVYIATPPSSHCELALAVAAAGKPCLVEKPMAMTHAECDRMVAAFRDAGRPLWVAYYRRALPRYRMARDLIEGHAIGRVTSVHIEVRDRLATGEHARAWRFDPAVAGAGLFLDLASHAFDMIDFLLGPITAATGIAVNTGGAYAAEDVTGVVFRTASGTVGTGAWNFNAADTFDCITVSGSGGDLRIPMFTDTDLVLIVDGETIRFPFRNPPHVHQPLVQTIVDELAGGSQCPSTGDSGARASWVMDRCVGAYYGRG
jgi:predicted dehydrogenase